MDITNKQLLLNFCENCDIDYCFLHEIITKDRRYSHRLLTQLKIVEIFKWLESEKANRDIGWHDAMTLFLENGHAKKFSDVYTEDLSVREIQKLMCL